MKRKYYLRGLGFGILITTFVFMLVGPSELSEEEIIQRAEQLGYVKVEETDKSTINLEELLNKNKEDIQASGTDMTIVPNPSQIPVSGTITPEATSVTPIQTIIPEDTPIATLPLTETPKLTVTSKPTVKPTVTIKPTATNKPTMKPTATVTPTVTNKATVKPTATVTPAVTNKATVKPTATVTPTATNQPTVRPTTTITKPTATNKPTMKPTATVTPTITNKPTVKPTAIVTPTATNQPTPVSKKKDVITATIRIKMGSSAMSVCKQLEKAGIIEDANDLIQYLADINKANYIDIGTYTLSSDMSFKEIADIITLN